MAVHESQRIQGLKTNPCHNPTENRLKNQLKKGKKCEPIETGQKEINPSDPVFFNIPDLRLLN